MTGERATKKQQELFTFVKAFLREHDYSPSYREIMNALGYKSVSTVAVHLDALIAKGYIKRSDNAARSLEVIQEISHSTAQTPVQQTSDDIIKKLDVLITDETTDNTAAIDTLIKALDIIGRSDDAAAQRERVAKRRSPS